MSVTVSHIVGPLVIWPAEDGPIGRQRCQWCGALLDETEYARTMTKDGEPVGSWEVGSMMRVSSSGPLTVRSMLEDEPSDVDPTAMKAPADACFRFDPAVTR